MSPAAEPAPTTAAPEHQVIEPPPAAGTRSRGQSRVRDRDVLAATAIAAAIVLGTQAVGVFVPGFDDLLGFQPVVIIVLIVVTVGILVQAVRAGLRSGWIDPRSSGD